MKYAKTLAMECISEEEELLLSKKIRYLEALTAIWYYKDQITLITMSTIILSAMPADKAYSLPFVRSFSLPKMSFLAIIMASWQ